MFDENLETHSDEEIEGNSAVHEKEFYKSSVPFPTVLQNIDDPDISVNDVVKIAPAEGQLPVSFTSEPNLEALAFPKEYSTGKLSIHYKRKPSEKDISPNNTVILSLIKSNMNLQYVTGIYRLLTYLTSYLCKSEGTMGELM